MQPLARTVRRWIDRLNATLAPPAGTSLQLNSKVLPPLIGLLALLQVLMPYDGWLILLTGLGGAWLISYLWARSLAQHLSVTREMRFGWAQVGDRIEERFTLRNTSSFPALWLQIVDHSTVPDYEAGRATGLGARERTRWRKVATCNRRGVFTIGPTTLVTSDPFGLYTVRIQDEGSMPFVVMPPVVSLPTIQIAPGGRAGDGRPRPNAPDRTVSASSVREYVPGDSLRWIHWRTSARRDGLFVRLFDGAPAGDWWILLDVNSDVQVGEGEDSTLEHAIIIAASLADEALQLKRSVGLIAHGESLTWLPPRSDDEQRWRILRALAELDTGQRSLAHLLTGVGNRISQYASLIVVTADPDPAWLQALLPLTQRGITPTVLQIDPRTFGGEHHARGVTEMLVDLGISHYTITRDLLDRPERRPGQKGHWDWRVIGHGQATPGRPMSDLSWRSVSQ